LPQNTSDNTLISVIVVNYKVPECLKEMIRSIKNASLSDRTEIIVVDNASNDGSFELITSEFSEVKWVQLKNNIGFGKACNIGAKNARGEFLLLINPDTVIAENTLSVAVEFMNSNPDAGIMGPKILNPDGSLQPGCRRSFPTPQNAFYRFSGLSKLFPKSPRFGKYNLTFLDQDQTTKVDAVSGSFMFIRRAQFVSIGGFDEQFFMYGEDLDLCWRMRESGYSVWYNPETQIIHHKGKSSAINIIRSRFAFYEAMLIFTRKYRHKRGGYFPEWLIVFGILFQATLNIGATLLSFFTPVLIDLAIINLTLIAGISLRFSDTLLFYSSHPYHAFIVHLLLSISFLFLFAYNGIYSKSKYSISNALLSGLLASLTFFASVYFIQSVAFSRIAFGIVSLATTILLVSWREIIPKVIKFKQLVFSPDQILIVGNGPVASLLIRQVEEMKSGKIKGILWTENGTWPGEYEGYQVLGSISNLPNAIKASKADTLLIATDLPWYSSVIEILSRKKFKNLTIRWVPHEVFERQDDILPSEIKLNTFSV
jgi:GT2 family glycosyltransferase